MNSGMDCVQTLYRDLLKVDDEWAVRREDGFIWWPDQAAQSIRLLGVEPSPDGDDDYLVSVRTEYLRDVEMTDRQAIALNQLYMPLAALSGPVYDEARRTVDLCSLVRVHRGNSDMMTRLLSVAAILQIAESDATGGAIAEALEVRQAASAHPTHGRRPQPDEMTQAVEAIFIPAGEQPGKWSETEFKEAVDRHMQQPPALLATAGDGGCAVEFPHGTTSSLCRMSGDQQHPWYGNGLLVAQSFPGDEMPEVDGARLVLTLNATELATRPTGYGFGSYLFCDGQLHFTCFVPNAAHRKGLLPNLYFSAAQRARQMSIRLTGIDWDADSFDVRRSGTGMLLEGE